MPHLLPDFMPSSLYYRIFKSKTYSKLRALVYPIKTLPFTYNFIGGYRRCFQLYFASLNAWILFEFVTF